MIESFCSIAGQEFCNTIEGLLVILLIVGAGIVIVAIGLLVIAASDVREANIPPDADFFETMRLIPITIPLALDMLDLVFDFLAAPISWLILEALGLKALRLVTIAEGLIPGTQIIPTLTVGWIAARMIEPATPSQAEERYRERQPAIEYRRRRRSRFSGLTDEPKLLDEPRVLDEPEWDEEEF